MTQIMLSEQQQSIVWEEWLSAQIRSNYFADLCQHYQKTQRRVTWATVVASSGAVATVLLSLPNSFLWLRLVFSVATAGLSAWALVMNYQRNSTECSDLHFRWNKLAIDYEALWCNMYVADAGKRLTDLRQREAELSKSSNAMPNQEDRMLKWTKLTVDQRTPRTTAS